MSDQTDQETIALIIGAGPAGLTAAYELLVRTDIRPVIVEMGPHLGGISRTEVHNGNRIDIGGHRFFSKSSRVTDFWQKFLPLQGPQGAGVELPVDPLGPDPRSTDRVMLVRERLSRICYLGKLFDYPLTLSVELLRGLGLVRSFRVGAGYLWARCFPIKPEKNLEAFLSNRFGGFLYRTFFKDYTE
ncbi:MAG: NAD(P)-binding protein, partial [Verrucomicrobiota bacterium]